MSDGPPPAWVKCSGVIVGEPSPLQQSATERILLSNDVAEKWLVFWKVSGDDPGKQAHFDEKGDWDRAACGVLLLETTRVADWFYSGGVLEAAMRRELPAMVCENCAKKMLQLMETN